MVRAALAMAWCVIGLACGPGGRTHDAECVGAECSMGTCEPGHTRTCYTGRDGTEDVGACHAGAQTCTAAGTWGDCTGEVVPSGEVCSDGIDNNCNGEVDENRDADGDGWSTCQGDCCDSLADCGTPSIVNPGAYEVAGDGVDNDCDGAVDNAIAACDQAVSGNSMNGYDYAAAMDICPSTALQGAALMNDPLRHWGVLAAELTLADGTGQPNPRSTAILPQYGTGLPPHSGSKLVLFSSGNAAGEGDPNFVPTLSVNMGTSSGFPADFLAAHAGKLPNAPGCPGPIGTKANDPVMLSLHVRVPTNAKSFSLDINFFSDEFPEFTCSAYNDFFVVLLDSTYTGANPNPADKDLAFYTDPATMKRWPVGVNLAQGTGLFTQCVSGHTGCEGTPGYVSSCTSTSELQGTGLEVHESGACDLDSLKGGGTGWLTTSGNVTPGEIMTLRIALWDTSDSVLDSLAVIDNFRWSTEPANPGTVIF